MGIDYREDRRRWGFRVFLNGKIFKKRYIWKTKDDSELRREYEAAKSAARLIRDLPPTSLRAAAVGYL